MTLSIPPVVILYQVVTSLLNLLPSDLFSEDIIRLLINYYCKS